MRVEEFLAARADDAESLARGADWDPARGLWRAEYPHGHRGGSGIVWNGRGQSILSNPHEPTCEHVVAWQPARVLALVASIREGLAAHALQKENAARFRGYAQAGVTSNLDIAHKYDDLAQTIERYSLRPLARIWSDHPDFAPQWAQ